ncbi:hypothetical protein J132_11165 [Termitomyces sp. J132]|nr:hypothetical protein J132_11165 [Termitomyces sp. J132]
MSISAGIAIPAFNNTLGAILVGGLLSMALWGVTCSQTFTFFTRNPRDSSLFKALVLVMLDTFDSVLNCHILYFYLVSNYLNPLAITRPICKFSYSSFVTIMAVSTLDLGMSLRMHRTDDLVNTLMTYTVYTGLIVGIDAALGMIFYTVMPSNFIFLAFYLLLSKLYLNSYLAVLNARDGLRKDTDEPLSIHLSQIASVHRSENHISTQLAQSQLKKVIFQP